MKLADQPDVTALPQGHVGLLDSAVAQRLLVSTELARLAYVAADGTPRVLPMLFHWTGDEIVLATFAGARKIAALRARPDVAITIDAASTPPEVLLVRGRVSVTDVDGIVPEYVLAQRRYAGEDQAAATLAEIDHPGTRMARLAVRPSWVGVLDFQTRLPGWQQRRGVPTARPLMTSDDGTGIIEPAARCRSLLQSLLHPGESG